MRNIITIQHTQSEQHLNKMIGSLGGWNLLVTILPMIIKIRNLSYTPLTCQEQNRLLKLYQDTSIQHLFLQLH